LPGFADRDQQTELNQTLPSKSPQQTAVEQSEPSLPQKLGAKTLLHLLGFSTTSRIHGEYIF